MTAAGDISASEQVIWPIDKQVLASQVTIADVMSDALIGQLVGNYQVLARLGRANTGYIYRVRHKFLKIDRAMQVLELRTPNLSERFTGDAERLAAIRHKSLVRVHEHGAIAEVGHYLLIELLAGESLAAALRRDGSMPVRQALKIVRDVASGLGEAHKAGVLHRAISTRALFLAREGGVSVAKLVSFGFDLPILGEELAAALDAKLATMDFRYASPEQLGPLPDGDVLDGRSDVYSLGLCLFEAMTGQVLFPQEDVRSALAARLETENVSPADRAPDAGIDPDLDELVVRMLAPSRFMRPNDAHDVAEELDAMLLRVRRPGRGEAPAPAAGRSRAASHSSPSHSSPSHSSPSHSSPSHSSPSHSSPSHSSPSHSSPSHSSPATSVTSHANEPHSANAPSNSSASSSATVATAASSSDRQPAERAAQPPAPEKRSARPSAGAERAKLAAAKMKEVGPAIPTKPRATVNDPPASVKASSEAAAAKAAVAQAAVAKANVAKENVAKATVAKAAEPSRNRGESGTTVVLGREPKPIDPRRERDAISERRQPTLIPRAAAPTLDVPVQTSAIGGQWSLSTLPWQWIAPVVAVVAIVVIGLAVRAGRPTVPVVVQAPVSTGPTLDLTRLDDVISRHDMSGLDNWLSTFPRSDYRERAYQTLLEWGIGPAVVCPRMEHSASDLLKPGMTFARICGR